MMFSDFCTEYFVVYEGTASIIFAMQSGDSFMPLMPQLDAKKLDDSQVRQLLSEGVAIQFRQNALVPLGGEVQ
mgnify:CR=1 FL=1